MSSKKIHTDLARDLLKAVTAHTYITLEGERLSPAGISLLKEVMLKYNIHI